MHWDFFRVINPLPLLFKSLLPGQEDCVFFSRHLNLHAKPETGIPYKEKNYNTKTKKDRMIILSDFIRQTTESYFLFTQRNFLQRAQPVRSSTLGTAGDI
jgi:hypothetical protein